MDTQCGSCISVHIRTCVVHMHIHRYVAHMHVHRYVAHMHIHTYVVHIHTATLVLSFYFWNRNHPCVSQYHQLKHWAYLGVLVEWLLGRSISELVG